MIALFIAAAAAAGSSPQFEVLSVLHHDEALNRAHDIEVTFLDEPVTQMPSKAAFVAGKGGSVAVVDVVDPRNPKLVWWRRDREDHDDAQTVLPRGSQLILGSRNLHSIFVPDAINPGALWRGLFVPQAELGRLSSDAKLTAPQIDRINGMAEHGDHVIAACKHGWVSVVDVRWLFVPRFRDALNARESGGLDSPHDLALFDHDRRLIVVNQRRGAEIKGRVYRIGGGLFGKKLRPAAKWKIEGSITGEDLNGANRVDIFGRYAVLACSPGTTVGVIDLSNPDKPRKVAVLPFAGEHPTGLDIAGSLAFVAGGQTLEVFDLTDPENPVSRAVFPLNSIFPTGRDNAHDLVYREGLLYLTAQNDNRIAILRILDQQLLDLAERPEPDDRLAPAFLRGIVELWKSSKPAESATPTPTSSPTIGAR